MGQPISSSNLPPIPDKLLNSQTTKVNNFAEVAKKAGIDNFDELIKKQVNETEQLNTTAQVKLNPDLRSSELNPLGYFSGFSIKYPEYVTMLPQTLSKYTVRTLKIEEEEAIKLSLLDSSSIPNMINRMIYGCIISKPNYITSYDDFIKNTTLCDREALLYAIYHVTYKDIQNYKMTCNQCGTEYNVTVNIADCFSINAYHGNENEILNNSQIIQLSVPEIECKIKCATIHDEEVALQSSNLLKAEDKQMIPSVLSIECFYINKPGGKQEVISGLQNIINGYKTLLPVDRKMIKRTIDENYNNYKIKLELASKCVNRQCLSDNSIILNILNHFFRAVQE